MNPASASSGVQEVHPTYYTVKTKIEEYEGDLASKLASTSPILVKKLGDLRGVMISPNPYAAALFCSFPAAERWRFCNNATKEEALAGKRMIFIGDIYDEKVDKLVEPNAATAFGIYKAWIAAVSLTKDMVESSLDTATAKRIAAWMGGRGMAIPRDVPTLSFQEYSRYSTWVQNLPNVREYIGLCCLGEKEFTKDFQELLPQVRMMNSYGRIKVAKMTKDMHANADIIGLYKANITPLLREFVNAWEQVSKVLPGNKLEFGALLNPSALAPIQGEKWNRLYSLGKAYYCRVTGANVNNFQGYNCPEILDHKEEYLKPIKRAAGSDLVSEEEAMQAKLPKLEIQEERKMDNVLTSLTQVLSKLNNPMDTS